MALDYRSWLSKLIRGQALQEKALNLPDSLRLLIGSTTFGGIADSCFGPFGSPDGGAAEPDRVAQAS